jgi:hypothetical protein
VIAEMLCGMLAIEKRKKKERRRNGENFVNQKMQWLGTNKFPGADSEISFSFCNSDKQTELHLLK